VDESFNEIEALYRNGFDRFVRTATAITGDPDRGLDAVQEAFARALRHRSGFRGSGTLEAWVWRIVVNTSRTVGRLGPPIAPEVNRAAARPADEDDAALRDAIAALPDRQRLVLFLRHYADLDYRTIADALEIAPGTVGAALHAAHASLRRELQEVSP
jgi:RNA polymerase sigma factor (sigma-70 family)